MMTYFLFYVLSLLFFISLPESKSNGRISRLINEPIPGPNEKHERRELVEFTSVIDSISAIAAATSLAADIAFETIQISDDGAKFIIDNYFQDNELQLQSRFIDYSGVPLSPPEEIIHKAETGNNGGVFSDDGPGTASSGIVQYRVQDPISRKYYCFSYMWQSDAGEEFYGLNWLSYFNNVAFMIRDGECINAEDEYTTYMRNSAISVYFQFSDTNMKSWLHDYNGGVYNGINDVVNDKNDFGLSYNDVNHNFVITGIEYVYRLNTVESALHKEIRLFSPDSKVAMSASVSLSDANIDHPTIKLSIGPYKKIYGEAGSGNWFIFKYDDCYVRPDNYDMFSWLVLDLGNKDDITDCYEECINRYGIDCQYFMYDIIVKQCTYIGGYGNSRPCDNYTPKYLGDIGDGVRIVILNTIKYGTEYELLATQHVCHNPTQLHFIGNFDTTDDCWDNCKSMDECNFFIFDVGHNSVDSASMLGKCYLQKTDECSEGRFEANVQYNIYRRCPMINGKQECSS